MVIRTRQPIFEPPKIKKEGELVLIEEACKGCNLCIEACKPEALVLSNRLSKQGYYIPKYIEEKCTWCNICELICPDLAIYFKKDPEENGEKNE